MVLCVVHLGWLEEPLFTQSPRYIRNICAMCRQWDAANVRANCRIGIGIPIKKLLCVLWQAEYDLAAVLLYCCSPCVTGPYCGMHGLPLHWAMKAIVIVIL